MDSPPAVKADYVRMSSNGRNSISSNHSAASNYMNSTSDGLFPDADITFDASGKTISDDMALSYGPKHHRNQMSGMMYAGNTQSLPPGLAPGSVARYNMANPSPSSERFLVEHLASFPQDAQDGHLTPNEALIKLKKISSSGGLWAQKMNMNISTAHLIMANADSRELIEEYAVEQISLCLTVRDDAIFDNVLIFTTQQSQDKVGAIHLFQCRGNEANVISDVINRQREMKAAHFMNGGGMNGRLPSSSFSESSSEADQSSPRHMPETRTEWNLHQRHVVARAVEAFQTRPEDDHLNNNNNNNNVQANSDIVDAKITRDVQILNKCIEEVENFVVMLKRINEARKQLQQKKSKGSKKKKVENILILQSQPPPDHRIYDVYQKFKHSLNLLGKLQAHISEPSAPELIHYLFVPLGIIVKVTGIDKARAVVDPLLTITAFDLLNNCLDSREYNFWQSLGPNWTLTKNAEPFKDRYFQPYMPVFADGWIPPEIHSTPQQEAAAKSTAAMVARMQVRRSSLEEINMNPRVIQAAMKFKNLLNKSKQADYDESDDGAESGVSCTFDWKFEKFVEPSKVPNGFDHMDKGYAPRKITPPPDVQNVLLTKISKQSSSGHQLQTHQHNHGNDEVQRSGSFSTTQYASSQRKMLKMGIVVYDYMAHNIKELTIHAGERVQILDDSRRWWLVRNNREEQGYVPSTVLEIPATETPPTTERMVHDGANTNVYSSKTSNSTHQQHEQQHHQQQFESQPSPIKRLSSGHGYDTNANYVNHNYLDAASMPQPLKTETPVMISVQLPNDSPTHATSYTRHQTTTQTSNYTAQRPPNYHQNTPSQPMAHQGYGVAVSRKVSNGYGGGEPATAEWSSARRTSKHERSTAVIKTQPSPPTVIHEEMNAPPPPPPPPPVAPPPPVHNFNAVTLKQTKTPPRESHLPRDDSSGDLQLELRNRLSMGQADRPTRKATPGDRIERSEGSERVELSHVENSPTTQVTTEVDTVDVFIPLYKSSTADDVSRWLGKLGFSDKSIEALKGKTALELFGMDKETLVKYLGNAEGLQLNEELQVQNGAKRNHQTMTELQKALVRRVQKREVQHETVKSYQPANDPPPVKSKPQVNNKTISPKTSPQTTNNIVEQTTTTTSAGPKQVTVESVQNEAPLLLNNEASLIKKQKEELERLKKENPSVSRDPGKATFSSFNSVNVTTAQGKTQL